MSSAVKTGKKKPLKSLITFHSKEIYERATAEPNTSALVEALLARHFGLDIPGDTLQAQLRRDALEDMLAPPAGGLKVPVKSLTTPAPPSPEDEINDEDGDLDEAFELPAAPAENQPTAEVAVAKPAPTVDEAPLPDRPVSPAAPVVGEAFAPAAATQPQTYTPGSRLCPNCGQEMGASPHCLNCL